MFDIVSSFSNLIDDYLGGVIAKDQFIKIISSGDFAIRGKSNYDLGRLFVANFILEFYDNYDFPSLKKIDQVSMILKRKCEYHSTMYISFKYLHILYKDEIKEELNDFSNVNNLLEKGINLYHNSIVDDFVMKYNKKNLENVFDIIFSDTVTLIESIYLSNDAEDMQIDSVGEHLTFQIAYEKIKNYKQILFGEKGFIFNAYYGLDKTIYSLI